MQQASVTMFRFPSFGGLLLLVTISVVVLTVIVSVAVKPLEIQIASKNCKSHGEARSNFPYSNTV